MTMKPKKNPARDERKFAGVAVRTDEEIDARLDRVADELTRRAAGVQHKRAQVVRVAMLRGLDSLESELGI